MSIQQVLTDISNNTTIVNAEKSASRLGQSEMDQDAFLQLLMTQLKYQDPLKPMGNAEFISQQAQFTQISELQKLNQTNNFMQASSLIGKEVTFQDPTDRTNSVTGVISEARITPKGTTVKVNDREFPLTDVLKGGNDMTIKMEQQVEAI